MPLATSVWVFFLFIRDGENAPTATSDRLGTPQAGSFHAAIVDDEFPCDWAFITDAVYCC